MDLPLNDSPRQDRSTQSPQSATSTGTRTTTNGLSPKRRDRVAVGERVDGPEPTATRAVEPGEHEERAGGVVTGSFGSTALTNTVAAPTAAAAPSGASRARARAPRDRRSSPSP